MSTSRSLTWWMRPGLPRFSCSSASVYYTERKPKNKKWGRPGNEASYGVYHMTIPLSHTVYDREIWGTIQWKTFEGENFCGFRGFMAIHEKFSPRNLGTWCPLAAQVSTCESFLHKNCISSIRKSFFLSKVFRYAVLVRNMEGDGMQDFTAGILYMRAWRICQFLSCILVLWFHLMNLIAHWDATCSTWYEFLRDL